jgi:methylenetetrahydrofolate/methylenetetrahydromethanopterin dehydrogenase (NADP+)
VWTKHPSLKALADVNAVPPLGIEGIEVTDKGAERDGKRVFGALGIGGLKMKIHRACVAQLFERNDAVVDLETIYNVARSS